jgi:L-amino acid N-acyltransferase YncA
MKIIVMGAEHWDEVKTIYWSGIKTSQVAFEESPPDSRQSWAAKFLTDLSLVCL